jgi:hypothetical protein
MDKMKYIDLSPRKAIPPGDSEAIPIRHDKLLLVVESLIYRRCAV